MEWGVPLEVFGRVLVAAVLGAVIGFERERDGHPAGTRTIATLAIGAAVFGAVSTRGFDEFLAVRSTTNVQIDVTRVASQVVVGIGFIGAGLIFRRGGTIQNLTTAASLWATAAIGLLAGVGNVGLAIAVTVVLMAILVLAPIPQQLVLERWGVERGSVRTALAPGTSPEDLRRRIGDADGASVARWRVEKHDGDLVVRVRLAAARGRALGSVVTELTMWDGIRDLRSE